MSVRGDGGDNSIVVSADAGGAVRVASVDGTTVNGRAAVTVGKASAGATIQMAQGGTDRVVLRGGLDVPGSVNAVIGAGELLFDGSFGP